ncbi:zinc finger protein ZAT12-like [Nicotiana sylvestris]|uniref:Zinc finger protein ZAT12-like n=1 Tax=Nicotiana sylvestris TaxID=4096 RepID=A0A1U7YER2_NICSY|nr:PREDICTED: zinc finger protein ZAT12-like [Nicotiana sylvestris]
MTLKRSREEESVSVEKLAMANCADIMKRNQSLGRRIFECKTCKKQFDSFQALGGYRASHKNTTNKLMMTLLPVPIEPKKHECSFCGEEFSLGQALGGHMRKHRDQLNQVQHKKKKLQEKCDESEQQVVKEKKHNSNSERILFLDLNLTAYENELMTGVTSI